MKRPLALAIALLLAAPAVATAVATHFTGKLSGSTPLRLVVKVQRREVISITSLKTDFSGMGQCWGTGGFVNSKPIKVSHDSFSNTQDALLTVQAGGYHYLITVKGAFSHNDTRVQGTLKLVDAFPGAVCAATTRSWTAKATS